MTFAILCIRPAELGASNLNDFIFDLLGMTIFYADIDLHVATIRILDAFSNQGESSHFSAGLAFGILGQCNHAIFALVVFGSH